jgi:hypothetical protein
VFIINGAAVSWRRHLQQLVYKGGAAEASRETIFILQLLSDTKNKPTVLHIDNASCIRKRSRKSSQTQAQRDKVSLCETGGIIFSGAPIRLCFTLNSLLTALTGTIQDVRIAQE